MAVLSHTLCPEDKIGHKNCTFRLFMKNAQHHPLDYLYSITVWVKDIIYKLKLD